MASSRLRAIRAASSALLVLLAGCGREKPIRSAHDYNVLLVTIDTLRADHVGAYGAKSGATPALDALARSGVRFAAAQSAVPLTLPSHTTILTGLLPPHHGIRNNGGASLPPSIPTLASTLSAAGYRTAAFIGAFVLDRRFGLSRGFDSYDDEISRDPSGSSGMEAERGADAVADRSIAWLNKPDARPFFAWVHFYDPHAPYAPPEPFRSRHASSPYDGEIAFVDTQLQRLVSALRQAGSERKTLIIVVGDHGESLGEHGEATHGLLLYEPTLHVPLIIRAPAVLPQATEISTAVSLADLAPTIAALVGHPMSGKLDGRDLSQSLLRGGEPPAGDLYAETEYPTNFGWSGLSALRRASLKYIEGPAPELYDLARDPRESVNLRNDRRREALALSQSIASLRSAAAIASSVVDAETRQKLASLGYVSSGPVARASHADPRTMAPLFRRFELAVFALHDGHEDEAVAELRKLVGEDNHNPVFRSTLARTLRRRGELEEAVTHYKDVVVTTPTDADAWYNLGTTLQELGRNDEADQVIREALRLDPKRAEAHNTFGIILFNKRDPAGAVAEFQKATELDPRDPRPLNNIGNACRATGDVNRAEDAFRRAIAISPDYADALNGLATILVQRDRPREALPLFDRALLNHPEFVEARLNRGIALQVMGNHAAAAGEYSQVIKAAAGRPQLARQREAAAQLLQHLPDRIDHAPIH